MFVSESRPPRKEYSKLAAEETVDKNDNDTRCSYLQDHDDNEPHDTRPTADLIDSDTSESSCADGYDGHEFSDDSDYGMFQSFKLYNFFYNRIIYFI